MIAQANRFKILSTMSHTPAYPHTELLIDGTWRRTGNAVGFTLIDKNGNVIPLRPGATWIQLVPLDMAVKQS